ncbi:MAG: hypothetical protein KJ072_01320 [Verrucomicrobia bacterium]|nr:hypothetical protein [Verrucomicrobiota bacterium]
MKGDFHEGLQSAKRDPVDAVDQNFDWERLYRHVLEDVEAGDMDPRLADAVMGLLQMLVPHDHAKITVPAVGLRVIALAWVLNPGYFRGCPSLSKLARRCGISPSTLARYSGIYSRLIGWRNRAQRHAWNWQKVERARSRDEKKRAKAPQKGPKTSRRKDASAS